MAYTNGWKLANGATITIGGTTYEDASGIGIPGNMVELIDITTLGSTRKEFAASDMPDSDEIVVTVPFAGTYPALTTGTPASCSITLPKLSKTITFSAHVTKVAPQSAEPDGKLALEITLKPTTAAS